MDREDEVLRYVIEVLERLGVEYAIGGSLATTRYGEPRATLDADIIARLSQIEADRLSASLPAYEFYMDAAAAREAIATGGQFNIIHAETAFKFDIFIPSDDVAQNQISRSRAVELIPGLHTRISPPEELILKKLEYYASGGSPKHVRDIAGMLLISGEAIDCSRIDEEAARLGLTKVWTEVRSKVRGS